MGISKEAFMKVAIPLFRKRISPNFLTAPELLVILAQGEEISSTFRFPLSPLTLSERKKKLLSLGVDLLICGGIDWRTKYWLQRYGIRVVDNTMGEVGEILSHLSIIKEGMTKEEKAKSRKKVWPEKGIGQPENRKHGHQR